MSIIEKYNIQNIPAFIHTIRSTVNCSNLQELIDEYNQRFKDFNIINDLHVLYELNDCLIINGANVTYILYVLHDEVIVTFNRYKYKSIPSSISAKWLNYRHRRRIS